MGYYYLLFVILCKYAGILFKISNSVPAHFSRANNLGENLEVYVRPASLYRPEGAEPANGVLRPPPHLCICMNYRYDDTQI
jgi:hypothetical protein